MPRSRKRHHSRSRSRSRSLSRDRSYDRHKKNDSHEKDGKRRRVDEVDSPPQKRSLSSESHNSNDNEVQRIEDVNDQVSNVEEEAKNFDKAKKIKCGDSKVVASKNETKEVKSDEKMDGFDSVDVIVDDAASSKVDSEEDEQKNPATPKRKSTVKVTGEERVGKNCETKETENHDKMSVSDSDDNMGVSDSDSSKLELKEDRKEQFSTPKKPLTPRQIQKKLESEKKKQQKQKEKEERERRKEEEKAKILAEKAKILAEKEKSRQQKETERQKLLEEKQKLVEQKQKEKELKEEQKRKEREEKEQKRKEKEEQEAQKRKEKELEKLKKQQEIEEKNKEKQKEEEKKQKTAALFVGFFKKPDSEEKERKAEKVNSNFMPFEVKSDMRLPPLRRNPLGQEDKDKLDLLVKGQNENASYLKDLKSSAIMVGRSSKTWPYVDPEDEVVVIEEDTVLGEKIDEDTSTVHKTKAKFLFFHDNRRPAYFGTWRKKSKFVKPRKPFEEDTDVFNYEEDSDDDWEDEEQGESLDASADEEDKEDNAEDEYEVDNEFFVPHGHLSDDEIDDEENSRLSPESLKQKLKLLKDEFDEDIKSKTHKLKPRSIGCIWFNKKGDNVEEAIQRYLQPFAMIVRGQVEIKKRSEIFLSSPEKKKLKTLQELPLEHIPYFLKIIHGNGNKLRVVIEEFLTYMSNNGLTVEVPKSSLSRFLKQTATYKKCKENGPMKNKSSWFVNEDIHKKYNVDLELPVQPEN